MEFKDIKKLIESFQKRRGKTIIILTVFLISVSTAAFFKGFFDDIGKRVASLLFADVPEIKCQLAYPLKLEKGRVRKQFNNPEITLTNAGPIKAVSFSVHLKTYLYDKNLGIIKGQAEMQMNTHGHLIFKKELQPADEIRQQVNGYPCRDTIAIYKLSLKYFRESDMKEFNRQLIFIMDDCEILPEQEYVTNPDYLKIKQAIESWRPPANSGKTSTS